MPNLLRRLRNAQVNSTFARKLLRLYFREGDAYRIALGPLRGCRLYYDSTVNFHAILGLWELESFNFLSRIFKTRNLIAENAVIVDVGANIGFTSIWFSKMVADKNGSVYSFEPAPPVLEILRRNLALNDILNVQVVEAVCSDRVGVADFFIGFHHHTSSLFQAWAGGQSGNSRQIEVAATSLDDFFLGRESRTPPDFIKMDIEGGGVYALKGCSKCIEAKRPMIWIESHTPEEDGAISDVLLRHQYRAFRLQTHSLVKNIRSTHPDVDGVWGTMLLFPTEDTEHIASLVAAH